MARRRHVHSCLPTRRCQAVALAALFFVSVLLMVTTSPQHTEAPPSSAEGSLHRKLKASKNRSISREPVKGSSASTARGPRLTSSNASRQITAPVTPGQVAAPAPTTSVSCTSEQLETFELAPGLHATACCARRHAAPLFVAVTSPVGNFNLRKALRQGRWLMSSFPPEDRASYMFFVSGSQDEIIQKKIEQEMTSFGDIVQLKDVLDTYMNLAVKSVAAAAWVNSHLGFTSVRYWLKVEDFMTNNFKDIDALVQHLSQQPHGRPYYGGGAIFGGAEVLRDGRWGCPRRHCPYEKYPVKYAGGQYLLSANAVKILSSQGLPALNIKDPYPIEDHFIASVLSQHNITVTEEKKLSWTAGRPYGAPSVIAGDFLLCLDTEDRPEVGQDEEGAWEGGLLNLPPGKIAVKAWYGDPEARWSTNGGKDVTETVKKVLLKKGEFRANNDLGDPAPGKRKVLLVKVSDAP